MRPTADTGSRLHRGAGQNVEVGMSKWVFLTQAVGCCTHMGVMFVSAQYTAKKRRDHQKSAGL